MNNLTLNEIENDMKVLAKLTKELLNESIDNFLLAEELSEKVIAENNNIVKEQEKVSKRFDLLENSIDHVNKAYDHYEHGLHETLDYEVKA